MDCVNKEHSKRVNEVKLKMPSAEGIESVANAFKIIGEPSRLKIILALMEGELCVYHIVEICGGTQSNVSHQLRILKDNKIIKSRKEGQNVLYSIADEHVMQIIKMSEEHLNCKMD